MSMCKLRHFRSVSKKDAVDIGNFHTSARVDNAGKNIVMQLHGSDDNSKSCDTAFFACFFPRQAATLAMKLLDACHKQGFDVDAFEDDWMNRSSKNNSDQEQNAPVPG